MSKSPTDATKSYCFSPLKNVWQIASEALKVNRIAFVGQVLLLLLVISSTLSCMGPIAYERVFNSRTAIPGAFTVVLAECPVGKSVLGGGYQVSGSPNDLWVSQSHIYIHTYTGTHTHRNTHTIHTSHTEKYTDATHKHKNIHHTYLTHTHIHTHIHRNTYTHSTHTYTHKYG